MRQFGQLDERISAIVAAESAPNGTLTLVVHAVDGVSRFHLAPVSVTLSLWRVDAHVVRIGLHNPATGSRAYFQGAAPALQFALELGLSVIR